MIELHETMHNTTKSVCDLCVMTCKHNEGVQGNSIMSREMMSETCFMYGLTVMLDYHSMYVCHMKV